MQRASVSLPRWPVFLACHVLSELHGRPTSKTFPHPEARLIFWDCQQSTTLARLAAAAEAAARRRGRRARNQRQQKEQIPPSWSTTAGLLLITPHNIASVLPGGSLADHSHAPRSCHGALFFSPATRPGVQEGFRYSLALRTHRWICIQPPARPVEDTHQPLLLHLFPARRFSLSRRPLIEHHPTAANNKPGPTVQTIARPSSILHHFIPHPSIRLQLQGVKFNSPTNPALSVSAPASKAFQLHRTQNYRLCVRTLFLGTDSPADPERQVRASVRKRGRALLVFPREAASPSPVAQPGPLANIGQEANLQDSAAQCSASSQTRPHLLLVIFGSLVPITCPPGS